MLCGLRPDHQILINFKSIGPQLPRRPDLTVGNTYEWDAVQTQALFVISLKFSGPAIGSMVLED